MKPAFLLAATILAFSGEIFAAPTTSLQSKPIMNHIIAKDGAEIFRVQFQR